MDAPWIKAVSRLNSDALVTQLPSNSQKVYSIWICLDNIPRKLENTISYYKMQNYKNEGIKDKEFRIDSRESDLLEIIIVRLGGEGQEEKGLLDLLYGLFSGNQKKVLSYIPDSDN